MIDGGFRGGLSGLVAGAYSVPWGLRRILRDRQLIGLTALPLIVTLVAYTLATVGLFVFGGDLFSKLWPRPDEGWLVALWWLGLVVGLVAGIAVLALVFLGLAEAIGGPFYDKMAIRILREHAISTKEPGLIEGTVPDLFRSFAFVTAAGMCWLVGLIPIVGLPFVALGAVIAWLGFASAAVNPALMVTGNDLGARLRYVLRYFLAMVGIGLVVSLSMLVPLLGLLSIPASIVGASELYANTRPR